VTAPASAGIDESRNLASGPLVWAATIVCTTVLLALLKQALWLVVPLLVAIVVYYALFPAVRRLSLAGVDRQTAAAAVAGTSFVGAVVLLVPMVSWLAAHAVSGEQALFRYLEGGRGLLQRTLMLLEARFGYLERLNLHEEVGVRLSDFGGTFMQEHLTNAVVGAVAWLPSLLLAPFFAFFFLRDGQRFLRFVLTAVPNAYFERSLYMIERVDTTARSYFQGMLKLTVLDTVCLGTGLWAIGIPGPFMLGLVSAVLAWVPAVGSAVACIIVVLVAATDLAANPWAVYAAVALFVVVRLLDDFVFMPLTVGRSLRMHPLPTVLLIFIGGAVAGIPGLILALPLAGVVMVLAGGIGGIIADARLQARHAFAKRLRARRINADLPA